MREIQKEFTKSGTKRVYTMRNHISLHNSEILSPRFPRVPRKTMWKTRLKKWKTTGNRSRLSTEHKKS